MEKQQYEKSIEVSKLQDELIELKKQVNFYKYDQLTGLKTRSDLEKDFNNLIKNNQTFIIHLGDINNLKSINAEYGYINGGDALIKKITDNLKLVFDHNYIYRIGGDEFIVFDFNLTEFNDSDNELTVVSKVIDYDQMDQSDLDIKKIISKMDRELRRKKAEKDRRGRKQKINIKNKLVLDINILNYEPVFLTIDDGNMWLEHSDEKHVIYLKEKED